MVRDSIDATGSGNNFRSGQTRIHGDRTRSTQDRGMSVRLVTGCSKGTRPEERRRAEVVPSMPQGIDRTTPSRIPVAVAPATTCSHSGRHLAVSATDGVRKNTTRGRAVDGTSAKTSPGRPPASPKSSSVETSTEATGARTPACAASSSELAADEESSDSRGDSGRERQDRKRHGARLTDPRAIVGNKGWDGRDCNGMQARSDGDAGRHRSSSIREDRPEGNLEGEQSPGRVGHRTLE